jgi:hypothetical protein
VGGEDRQKDATCKTKGSQHAPVGQSNEPGVRGGVARRVGRRGQEGDRSKG